MTQSVILTSAHIERLKSGALADREVSSLSVIVAGPAKKQWRFKRIVAGTKKTVELILGTYPAFSIDEAREWAGPLSKVVVRGEDPRETRRAEEAPRCDELGDRRRPVEDRGEDPRAGARRGRSVGRRGTKIALIPIAPGRRGRRSRAMRTRCRRAPRRGRPE